MSFIRQKFNMVEVTEEKNHITISGVYVKELAADIANLWTTTKISKNMFVKATSSYLVIPSFFAIEFAYMLQALMKSPKTRSSKYRLQNIHDLLLANTWLNKTQQPVKPWFNFKATDAFIYTLLPHQVDFLKKYETAKVQYGLKGVLLYAPPGAGKTTCDIAFALGVEATKVIIVSPKNAIYRVWENTLVNQMKVAQHPYISDRDGDNLDPRKKYHVFHYESLERAFSLIRKWNLSQEKVCIILDECHNFNDLSSLRTNRFIQLCDESKATDIVWASGTPIKALGSESIPLIRTIDPLFTPKVEQAFKGMYGRDAKRTLDILQHRLALVSFTVPKQNVMPDKPIEEQINVKIPNGKEYLLSTLRERMREFVAEQTKHYESIRPQVIEAFFKVVNDFEATLTQEDEKQLHREYLSSVSFLMKHPRYQGQTHNPHALITNKYEKERIIPWIKDPKTRKEFIHHKSIVKYTQLKVRGECLGLVLTKARVQCHLDMLEHINFQELIDGVDKKTIIFTSYVKVLEDCEKHIRKLGYKPVTVYGENTDNLPAIVGKFDKDDTLNPLIATYQSLSTAVPLIMANSIIFLNAPWRSFERDQAIARAHRLGQDKPVYIFDIILDTGKELNISSRSLDIMQWSREQVELITGIKEGETASMEDYMSDDNHLEEDNIVDDIVSEYLEDDENPEYSDGVSASTNYTDDLEIEVKEDKGTPLHEELQKGLNFVDATLPKDLTEAMEAVSTEFMNPFTKLVVTALAKLRNLFGMFRQTTERVVKEFTSHRNIKFGQADVASKRMVEVEKKQALYADVKVTFVYCPQHLAKKQTMVNYLRYVHETMLLAKRIGEYGGREALETIEIFIGNPAKMSEPTSKVAAFDDAKLLPHLNENRTKMATVLSQAETESRRRMSELYPRVEDWRESQRLINEIMTLRVELIKSTDAVQKRVADVNNATDKLLALVQSKPETYKMSEATAGRLSQLCYVFAREVELFGTALNHAGTAVTCMIDTARRLDGSGSQVN